VYVGLVAAGVLKAGFWAEEKVSIGRKGARYFRWVLWLIDSSRPVALLVFLQTDCCRDECAPRVVCQIRRSTRRTLPRRRVKVGSSTRGTRVNNDALSQDLHYQLQGLPTPRVPSRHVISPFLDTMA